MRRSLSAAGAVVAVLLLVCAGSSAFVQPVVAAEPRPAHSASNGWKAPALPAEGWSHATMAPPMIAAPGAPGPSDAVMDGPTAQYHALTRTDAQTATARSYSRHDDSNPLDNAARSSVYDAISAAPGVYLARVSERTGIPRSTVRYHVRVLESEGLVSSAKLQGKRRFFATDVDDVELAAALHDDSTAAVLDALVRLGPANVSAIADELDLAAATASYHLDRLEDAGAVERERVDNAVVNSLSSAARAALQGMEAEVERAETKVEASGD